ncbi:hypothetical protein AMJ52_09210 [candidate division TA06 bacterium DG_78]|uniref:PFL domain-containing protein n=1 Tax=candidate division TA06 bacterium DG_78 TaxID=1703772 RepID=A0A0S7Y8P9_UNCT6|nr:MAG: hypothetical protein AMJ52_09210 [candidate division TA06 bacterium DG_78]
MPDKKTTEEILAGMDEAAKQAKIEFEQLPDEVKKHAAAWLRKWYGKAGYKRLGRLLVAYAKEQESTGKTE